MLNTTWGRGAYVLEVGDHRPAVGWGIRWLLSSVIEDDVVLLHVSVRP